MSVRILIGIFAVTICSSGAAGAQPRDRGLEVFGGVGWGHLFRVEDRTFGDRPNVAAGIGVHLSPRVRLEFEVNETMGLEPEPALCGAPPGVTCIGTGRSGVRTARIASGNVLYFFSHTRSQPYVTGGLGALWTKGVESITFAGRGPWLITEQESRDTGLAWNVGAGVRIAVTQNISVRPEFRIYDSTIQSRQNLNLIRASVAVGYAW